MAAGREREDRLPDAPVPVPGGAQEGEGGLAAGDVPVLPREGEEGVQDSGSVGGLGLRGQGALEDVEAPASVSARNIATICSAEILPSARFADR